jgi:hypothetical protein
MRRILCWSMMLNVDNESVFTNIIEKCKNFENEKAKLLYDSSEVIKEFTLEK